MEPLLSSEDRELLARLSLATRRRLAGQATGEQRSPSPGGGIEFADYREYLPGDDVRQVDWTVFLRLRKLLVKLSAEEKEVTLVVLLDRSLSMSLPQSKFRTAQRVAAVLGGIALTSGNRAGVLGLGDALGREAPQRGAASVPLLADRVARFVPDAHGNPLEGMRQFAARFGHRCLAVLITDLLYSEWPQVLAGLAASGCDAHVLHLLAPEELEPQPRGELTLVGLEDADEVPLHVDLPTLERYRAEANAWLKEVEAAARGQGIGYTLVRSDASLRRLFLQDLVGAGLVC